MTGRSGHTDPLALRTKRAMAGMMALSLVLLTGGTSVASGPVDLELVLAIDSSDSVDAGEFELQVRGLAAAVRHPDVLAAIDAGFYGSVAITVIEWASAGQQVTRLPCTRIDGLESAAAAATAISGYQRSFEVGVTSLSGALDAAMAAFAASPFQATRRTIDVVADGRQNDGRALALARADVLASGVTINALAIQTEYYRLQDYFRQELIGGPGAFVETTPNYQTFPAAILRKIIREISSTPLS